MQIQQIFHLFLQKRNGIFYLLMIYSLCRMSLTDSFCANLYVQSRNVVLYCFHEEYRRDI